MSQRPFVFVPVGSHGDVHPLVGLAVAMQARGHRCIVCANGFFRELIEKAGLEFVEFGTAEQYLELTSRADVWHVRKGPMVVLGVIVNRLLRPVYFALLERWQREPFVLVASPLCLSARLLQETHGVPLISTHLQPMVLRTQHEAPGLPGIMPAWAPAWWIRFVYRVADATMIDPVLCPPLNAFRAELGLPPVTRVMNSWWNSPQRILGLWPAWFAPMQLDWPPQTTLVGFPMYDERATATLPPALDSFLAEGSPPIAFTPGSAMRHGRDFFETAVAACERLGRRGLLLTRFTEHLPSPLPPHVLHVPFAPFSALLPRCAAIVHHGGIGTLAQGLAAGIPQLLMPMSHDQPDNLRRLQRLGVGDGLPPKHFTPANVSRLLGVLLADPKVQQRCQQLKRQSAETSGLTAACDALESEAATCSALH